MATFSFAIALYIALHTVGLITGQNVEITSAALAATAASLCAVALTFECYDRGPTRKSEWQCLLIGFIGLPIFVAIFAGRSPLSWVAISAVLLRTVVMIYRARSVSTLLALCASALVGYWAFLLTYVDGYKTPWVDEAVLSGTAHVDMMFHAAIVNMLTGFNAPSLGVDGIAPFPYHFASHHLVGLLCQLLKVGSLEFYAIVFPLLLGPLFLLALFFFGMTFRGYLHRMGHTDGNNDTDPNSSGPFWVSFFVVFVGLISASYRRDLGIWDNAFHSESFGVAVLFSYIAGVWLLDQFGREAPIRLRWYAFPLIAIYLTVLCSMKISVGAVVGALLAYAALRLPMAWTQRFLAWLAMSCAVIYGYVETQVVTQGENAGPGLMDMIKPFAFIRDIMPPDRWTASFFAFFGPTILFIALRMSLVHRTEKRFSARGTLFGIPLDVEFVAAITVISIAPSLILSIPQGATNFFSEVSYWWVQPMLAVVLASILLAATRPRSSK